MNSTPLNIRIPYLLKDRLITDAKKDGLSISDFVREILIQHYGGNKCGYNDDYLEFANNDQLFNSNKYIFLISWMHEKRYNAYDTNQLHIIHLLKNTVLMAMSDPHLPFLLKKEFEKVFVDLDRYIKDFNNKDRYFWFCKPNDVASFNYQILLEHVLSKSTDS